MRIENCKAIFFDLDHTLCDTSAADKKGVKDFNRVLADWYPPVLASEIGRGYLEAIYGAKKNDKSWHKIARESELAFRARLLELTIQLQVGNCLLSRNTLGQLAQRFMALRVSHLEFFPGVLELLLELKRHYTLSIVTNGPLFSQEPKVAHLRLQKIVDHVVLAGEYIVQKPDPKIFKYACRLSGNNPDEVIFVGDNFDVDVCGAKAAGLYSVWVSGGKPVLEERRLHPDIIVNKVVDIAPWVKYSK